MTPLASSLANANFVSPKDTPKPPVTYSNYKYPHKRSTDDTTKATFPFIVQRQSLDPSFAWILERIRMDNGCARKDAMDIEGEDRLSSLPDDVIHKIFSFISIKDAIGASVLSSRWRFIWTTMPYLNFENLNHRGPKFISNVLSHHNNRIQVSSLNLILGGTIMDYESISTPTGFPSLEKVDLYMYDPSNVDACEIVSLLQHFTTAKLLILSLEILQFPQHSSSMELIHHQACAFANTNIIKFITKSPIKVYLEVRSVTMSTEIKNCDTCPSAMFPMVSYEEIKAMEDMADAQLFVEKLGLFLKECNTNKNSDTNMNKHGKPQVKKQWAWELQQNLSEMMAQIKQSKYVAYQTSHMMENFSPSSKGTLHIIAWLQENRSLFQCIEGLMTRLSASKRAVMQPKFSILCKDAAILTYNILGWMKTIDKEDALSPHQVQHTINRTSTVYRRRRHKE
ncbi:hypothetical protein L2E82_43520 [Cichorium intybus]|uniref:Uncharacterized protein n=1 Tax=Cichorium intybus TaxID=13427 RepID=A0ACB8ZT53_CICIN|nr:hypothetical protein L2E82_43520 [Cichorium intybus]